MQRQRLRVLASLALAGAACYAAVQCCSDMVVSFIGDRRKYAGCQRHAVRCFGAHYSKPGQGLELEKVRMIFVLFFFFFAAFVCLFLDAW